MLEEYLITVIVPFYRCENYFENCLKSIINQTHRNLEIFLIDDCGGDSCIDIAERFATQDSRIKVLRNKKNMGQGYSRNIGIKAATGDYIAFVDADDSLKPVTYEILLKQAIEKDTDITFCNYNLIYQDEVRCYRKFDCFEEDKIYSGQKDSNKILSDKYNVIWNALFKKSFLLDNNLLFGYEKFEDMVFYWKACLSAKAISYVKRPLYNYNQLNTNSDTKNKNFKYKEAVVSNLEKIVEIIREKPEYASAFANYAYNKISWLMCFSSLIERFYIKKRYYKCLSNLKIKEYKPLIIKNFWWRVRMSLKYA